MKFQGFCNNRSTKTKRDCVVRALATATGIDYATMFYAMKEEGRRDDKGFPIESWLCHLRNHRAFGFHFRPSELSRHGTYLCWNSGHAWCVKDGILHDDVNKGKRYTHCFLVVPTDEPNETWEILKRARAKTNLLLAD